MQDPEVRKTIHSVNTYLRAEGILEVIMALEYDYGNPEIIVPKVQQHIMIMLNMMQKRYMMAILHL